MSTMHVKQNYMINFTTHNREEKKYKNQNIEIIEQYLGKESTYVGTDEEKILM